MSTLIIAEAGVNHNGDVAIAKQLIDVAARAGADLVKFQTFSADRLVTSAAAKADYQTRNTGSDESQHAMLRRLELSRADHDTLIAHAAKAGIGFFSTGFDIESVDMLLALGATRIKIPSGEITNLPYLRHVGGAGRDVILSSGMATLAEVTAALQALEAAGTPRARVTVLHCTTDYPAAMGDVNLRAMLAMRAALEVDVGYSDHTVGIEVAIAAVALGATVIEKHFTLDRSLPGPDHRASLEPGELAAMVAAIRNIGRALGESVKQPSAAEEKNRAVVRKSLVAACAIAAGESFSPANVVVKRPGTGISPMRWDEVMGRRARRAFVADELLEL
ncbi:MAG TPA: N-acetylneuraminate synthase [Steroidobacteraceae bacterium]|nr:N-acetylneuraminate synthase [Steroidobacteraceae bacterium]